MRVRTRRSPPAASIVAISLLRKDEESKIKEPSRDHEGSKPARPTFLVTLRGRPPLALMTKRPDPLGLSLVNAIRWESGDQVG